MSQSHPAPESLLNRLRNAAAALRAASGPRESDQLKVVETLAATFALPPTVAVLGEFNAGKSTLINLLLGQNLLPTGILPTTPYPLRLKHGKACCLLSRTATGCLKKRTFANGEALASFLADGRADHTSAFGCAEAQLPLTYLKQFRLLDTPGYDARESEFSTFMGSMAEADAALCCVSAITGWKETDRLAWRAVPAHLKRLSILVVTQADCLNDWGDRQKKLDRTREDVGSQFSRVVMTSLREASEACSGGRVVDNALWGRSGFGELSRAIAEVVLPWRTELQAVRALARTVDLWCGKPVG